MRRAIVLLLLACGVASAQPTPPGGLQRVTHDASLTGTGQTAAPLGVRLATGGGLQGGSTTSLGLITTCSSTQVLAWNGTAWACAANGSLGPLTSGKIPVANGTSTITDSTGLSEASNVFTIGELVTLAATNTGPTLLNGVSTASAYAGSLTNIGGRTSGTLDATATDRSATGGSFVANATRSAGTNNVDNFAVIATATNGTRTRGIYCNASGGSVENYCYYGFAGAFQQNGAAAFGSTVAITSSLTADGGNRVIDTTASSARIVQTANSIDLATTAVTAGSCTYCSLTVDPYGRLTAQSSGTSPTTGSGTAGTMPVWATSTTLGNSGIVTGTNYTYTSGTSGTHTFANAGGNLVTIGPNGIQLPSSEGYAFASTTLPGTTDLRLTRSGAKSLLLDDGAAGAASLTVVGAIFGDGGNRVHTAVGTGLSQSTNTVSLANTAVTAGSCTYCSLTVNGQGQLTAQSSGTTPLTGTMVSGTIPVGNGTSTLSTSSETDNGTTFKSGSTFAVTISSGATTTGALTTPFGVQFNGSVEDVDSILQLQLGHPSSGVSVGISSSPTGSLLNLYGSLRLNSDLIYDITTNGGSTFHINPAGYLASTTQFRDTEINDGKGTTSHAIAHFTGSTLATEFFGAVTLDTTLAVLGNVTLGDAQSDTTTIWGNLNGAGGTPTLSANCNGSGTATIVGTNLGGTVTLGATGSITTCTVNWVATRPHTPYCQITHVATKATPDGAEITAQSATATTFGFASSWSGDAFNYSCPF